MPTIAITMKLHLRPSEEDALAFTAMSKAYMEACNFVSQYAFDNGSFLSTTKLHKALYQAIRSRFGLKAQTGCFCIPDSRCPLQSSAGAALAAPVPLQG